MDPPCPPVLVPWGSGGPEASGHGPPMPWSVFTCPAPCSLQPRSLPARRLWLLHRDCPQGHPAGIPWLPGGQQRPRAARGGARWGVTGGLFLLVASPRAILQVGLCARCSFLTLIPATGWVWDGITLWNYTPAPGPGPCWCCGGADGAAPAPSCPRLGCPTLGVSLCQIPPGLLAWPCPPGGLW